MKERGERGAPTLVEIGEPLRGGLEPEVGVEASGGSVITAVGASQAPVNISQGFEI